MEFTELGMDSFEARIDRLDLGLFDAIESQTSELDRRSMLAFQRAARELFPDYVYLEIGSHLGGSIQPYLLDDRCRKIYSIDKRPGVQPDERGVDFVYANNSTARMLKELAKVSEAGLAKVKCIDGDVSEIDPMSIGDAPDICFIDGEHTDTAAWRDFNFCLSVAKKNCLIVFHDAAIIYNTLARAVMSLGRENVQFKAYNLPEVLFVIELGNAPIHRSPVIMDLLVGNHVGYLSSLRFNDEYRRFATKPAIKFLRKVRSLLPIYW